MTRTGRSAALVFWAAVAVGCGSVTGLSVDGSADGAGAGGQAGAAGAMAGAGGHAGAAGAGGIGGASGQGGAGGGVCTASCAVGRACCGGGCVNLNNDPMNCGTCGMHCAGPMNLCSNGKCVVATCAPTTELCAPDAYCCGSACCLPGQLCCDAAGPVGGGPPTCFTPTADQPTCPQGCAPLCRSDRNQKRNIQPVDAGALLERVGRLPISTWTYREEPDDVRHLGPMAQDFRAAFGLGDDDRTYYAVDAQGVALAAIKELDRLVTTQEQRIAKLERENRELARRLQALQTRPRR
jgi:hypothetical protein